MSGHIIDLKQLAEDAAQYVSNQRAHKCRPWSHQWTMWHTSHTYMRQSRRCVACGIEKVRVLARRCDHMWKTDTLWEIYQDGLTRPIGKAHLQSCSRCGDLRRRNLY